VDSEAKPAHLFLQRILYRINRLVLFWCAECSAPRAAEDLHHCVGGRLILAWKMLKELVEQNPEA